MPSRKLYNSYASSSHRYKYEHSLRGRFYTIHGIHTVALEKYTINTPYAGRHAHTAHRGTQISLEVRLIAVNFRLMGYTFGYTRLIGYTFWIHQLHPHGSFFRPIVTHIGLTTPSTDRQTDRFSCICFLKRAYVRVCTETRTHTHAHTCIHSLRFWHVDRQTDGQNGK